MRLPAALARALGVIAWPDDPAARETLTRGTRGPARLALLAWAHARAGDPPTIAQWAALLGVAPAALRSLRHELALTLPVARAVRAARDVSTLAASSVRRRRSEARARGEAVPKQKPGRVAKKPAAKKRRRQP